MSITEKDNFNSFAEFNPRDRKVTHCCLCEYQIDSKICYGPDVPIVKPSCLDFLIRKEYQFLKNLFTEQKIKESPHLPSLSNYYDAMNYLLKVPLNFRYHSDHPVTRGIHGYLRNFCNKKVREMTNKNGRVRKVADNNSQYFSCVFHNGFKFDMTFLAKGIWLSLWKTDDISLLDSSLTDLKSYNIGKHINFIDSIKCYQ